MQSTERLTEYAAKKARVDAGFQEAGIDRERVRQSLGDAMKIAGEFCANITEKTAGQSLYDETVNIPCGILRASEPTASHAFETALVSSIGQHVRWDINKALELCGDILEDVNAHGEAAKVRAMIEG